MRWAAYADVTPHLISSITPSRILLPRSSIDKDRRGQHRGKVAIAAFASLAFRPSHLRHSTDLGRGKDDNRTRPKGGSNPIKDFAALAKGHGRDQRATVGLPLMTLRRSRRWTGTLGRPTCHAEALPTCIGVSVNSMIAALRGGVLAAGTIAANDTLRRRGLFDHKGLWTRELEVMTVLGGAMDIEEGQIALGSHRFQGLNISVAILFPLETEDCCR